MSKRFSVCTLAALACTASMASMATMAAKASASKSADYTSQIKNPSFENGLPGGWQNNGMQTQTNTEPKAMKVGSTYCEKWVKAPATLENSGVSQTLKDMPAGDYILEANCHAELQGTDGIEIKGVTLFIGDKSVTVGAPQRYRVIMHSEGGDIQLGFKIEDTNANWVSVDDFTLIWAENAEDYLLNIPYKDCTSKINNNSFENGFPTGWENNGMQSQKNNEAKAMKAGNVYCEKWVESPNALPDASITQKLTDLEPGDYILSANSHAELQSDASVEIKGVSIFAGDKSANVTVPSRYDVMFHTEGGDTEIGFKVEGTNANWVSVDNFTLTWVRDGKSYLLNKAVDRLQQLLKENEIITDKMRADANALIEKAGKATTDEEFAQITADINNAYTQCNAYRIPVERNEPYVKYLFAYFPNNDDENLYYAVSDDGFKYTPLNNGKRVMWSDTVAIKKGIRDPHMLRGEDGKTFYMVATDMKCSQGWDSNRGMVLYKSTDLVNWTHATVNFPTRFPEWKNVTRVWAPETIWDADHVNADGTKGAYLVYYSLLTNDGKCPYDKVFYSYANADFTDLTEPEFFYDRGGATIDCDIVFDETDRLYHMIFKNEGAGGICAVTAKHLTPAEGEDPGTQWSAPSAPIQQTNKAVEGGGIFRLINTNDWVVMYDCYNSGYYQFCSTTDWQSYKLIAQTTTSGAFTPRHGSVLPITAEEYDALLKAFPTKGLSPINPEQNENAVTDVTSDDKGNKYYSLSGAYVGEAMNSLPSGIYVAKPNNGGKASKITVK